MITGDLSTMSLADLLQWMDASNASGKVDVERTRSGLWLHVRQRRVVACSTPPVKPVAVSDHDDDASAALPLSTLAIELLYDQFLDDDGRFRFVPANEPDAAGVALDIAIPKLVMEGMRHRDEWPGLKRMYRNDAAKLQPADGADDHDLPPLQREVQACARRGFSLHEARLHLGLSRPALLRRIEQARLAGRVRVEGAPAGGEPLDRMIEQARRLLQAHQFDEATHVLDALLQSDPTAQRVKDLLQQAEQDQVMALYRELPPDAIVVPIEERLPALDRLSSNEREVLQRINGRWDVAILVMASPTREVETLKCVRKLWKLGAVQLVEPSGLRASRNPS